MLLNTLVRSLQRFTVCGVLLAAPALSMADAGAGNTDNHAFDSSAWYGNWQVENTTFIVQVLPVGNRFTVEAVQPLGLGWTSSNGIINGNSGTINVQYQGVTALVMIQLLSHSTAVARAMSCQPDYHVVCTLVRNQQAAFIKQ